MKDKKYYRCDICGNMIEILNGNENNIKCCNKNMSLLIANSSDASNEKHVPVYKKENDKLIVSVGEVPHPMEEEHYIMWISLVSRNTTIKVDLMPNIEAKVVFPYIENSTIYAYCNKHGLWKNEVE